MKSKLGPAGATTATAHKIAIIFYTRVKKQVEYAPRYGRNGMRCASSAWKPDFESRRCNAATRSCLGRKSRPFGAFVPVQKYGLGFSVGVIGGGLP